MAKIKHTFPKMLNPIPKLNVPIYDLPSNDYHAISGTYSSSQLKDLLDDEQIFLAKHVHKTVEKLSISAFDVGTYFHTGVLEPHKLKIDCAVFDGKIRRGERWEAFKKKNEGKAIVSPVQISQAEGLIETVKDSPIAMGYIERGTPEVSFFTELIIHGGEIYSAHRGVMLCPERGWINSVVPKDKKAVRVIIKVRADSWGDDFILDLKSTTGNARSAFSMRQKISYYQYDLSASLYSDMFALFDGVQRKFVWTFASKDFHNSKTYVASMSNMLVGRAKYRKALLKLAECISNKWQLYDELGTLEPLGHELEHIKKSDTDFI